MGRFEKEDIKFIKFELLKEYCIKNKIKHRILQRKDINELSKNYFGKCLGNLRIDEIKNKE